MSKRKKDTMGIPNHNAYEDEDRGDNYYNDDMSEYEQSHYDGDLSDYDEFDDDSDYDQDEYDQNGYEEFEVEERARKYLDSDPYIKSVYGEMDYSKHIEDEESEHGRQTRTAKNKQRRSERYRPVKKKEPRTPKKHKKKHYFLKFLGLCLIIAGLYMFLSSSFFNVDSITIKGNALYTDKQITEKSGLKTGGNIFTLRGHKAEKALEKDSYISDANVDRSLPNKITITITERNEIAYIPYGKKFIIIDTSGFVLKETTSAPKLTRLEGVDVTLEKTNQEVQVKDAEELNNMLSLLKAMEKGDVFFKKISISKGTTKAYINDQLVCKGETKYVIKNVKNGNVKLVISDLLKKNIKKGSISIGDDNYCSYSPDVEE